MRVVGRYCELRKKGNRYWACCPFHKEKTPSFSLDPETGLFYCFGCREGGNLFSFLQKMDGLTFSEALERLAAEANVDISEYKRRAGPDRSRLARMRELNELATTYYQECLRKARGGPEAREYLAGRQISDESIETWRIGYAPEGWDNLSKCAARRDFGPDLLVGAGLAVAREDGSGYYDRFRNRLMFPIADRMGRTIGFGGRALAAGDEPKYVNTPGTPLFSKGECFFGLSRAKEAVRSSRSAVLLEGYTDVIMAHQAGVAQALAVLGTALTQEHALQLSRLCESVTLVFDPDEAGTRSAARSIEVLLGEGLQIRVTNLPEGLDPCDFIVEHGGDAFCERLDQSAGFFEWRLALARRRHDVDTLEGRGAAFDELAQIALAVRDEAQRDMIVRWIARELGVREDKAWAAIDRRATPPARARGTDAAGGAARLSAHETLPRDVLGMLLAHPEWLSEAVERLDVDAMHDGPEKQLLALMAERHDSADEWDTEGLLSSLSDPGMSAAGARAMAEEQDRTYEITQKVLGLDAEEMLRRRFESYVDFLEERKYRAATTTAAPDTDSGDDDEQNLRAYYQRRLEKDRKSRQVR